jgi:hypothetical protein
VEVLVVEAGNSIPRHLDNRHPAERRQDQALELAPALALGHGVRAAPKRGQMFDRLTRVLSGVGMANEPMTIRHDRRP